MARDNDVFQVLVTKGNQATLAADKKITDLKDGQIGVFDANTKLTIDGTKPVEEFFIAVGVNPTNAAEPDSINTSAGELVQTRNIGNFTYQAYKAPLPKVVEISGFKADCETDYAIKVEFRNQKIYRSQGFQQYTHVYNIKTSCCEKCEDCPSGDCNEIVKLFVEAINRDPKGLVKAEAINPTGNVVVTDIDAFILANQAVNNDDDPANDVCLKIRLTSLPLRIEEFCSINPRYFKPRETELVVSLVQGFNCNGTVTTTQEIIFEQGSGYDVREREYKAGGWNGRPGPYRTSCVTGLYSEGFKYFADAAVKYDRLALEYQNEATGGWLDYKNDLATEIAIPNTDSTTLNSLVGILNKIVKKFNQVVIPTTP
jgi:hypothetical protein